MSEIKTQLEQEQEYSKLVTEAKNTLEKDHALCKYKIDELTSDLEADQSTSDALRETIRKLNRNPCDGSYEQVLRKEMEIMRKNFEK